jgi:hypothetical protein
MTGKSLHLMVAGKHRERERQEGPGASYPEDLATTPHWCILLPALEVSFTLKIIPQAGD